MRPRDLPSRDHFEAMPCGSRAKYVGARCRCMLCRAANSRYQSGRAQAIRDGDANGLVPAGAARAHLFALSRQGVGRRAVRDAADVAVTVLQDIRSGAKTQIRKHTERRILAVTAAAVSGGARVSAKQTQKQITELLEEGFSKAELARRLGYQSPALQINRRRVTAANAMRVDRFYQQVMAE